ncbi:hypothetical protein MMC30_001856 [Trapelia coarctata]|nr:hypothetical protein [Trapelia coarctata]
MSPPATTNGQTDGQHAATKIDFTARHPLLIFTFHNIINGQLTYTKETRHSLNPATAEPNPESPVTTQQDLDNAVAAAKKALKSWSQTTYEDRRQRLHAYADAFESYREDFVKLIIAEQGKAHSVAQDEFDRTLKMIRVTPTLELKEELVEDTEEKTATVRYVPIGVTCGLVPWNYPVLLAWVKIAPALYAGNTFILKPSPDTPYCGLKLVELAQQFFPPGVLQALAGGHELGPMFTVHPGIEKVSFTGSIETGKRVMESCAKTLKRVTLELGGNDAAIICEDVDIDQVAPAITTLALLNSGQICMDIKRVYIHEKIYDRFLAAMVAYSANFKVGPSTDPTNFIGPLQNATQYEKVQSFFSSIGTEGLKIAVGPSNPSSNGKAEGYGNGYFITPTIIDNPPDNARIVVEEPFGPIFPTMKWSDEEDVIARANDSKNGLGASVWSADTERAERMARRLEAGSVWVNMHFEVQPNVPYGGHKWSGLGMEWGLVGLKGWCNTQAVWVPKKKA